MAGYGALRQDDEMPVFPPPLIYSNASANYARLCLLVIDVGTPAVAKKVLENLPKSCISLSEALDEEREKMEHLRDRNIITDDQFEQLYPNSGAQVDIAKIDLGLWVKLLRNVTADAKRINQKWQEKPQYLHLKYYHDIQRLKLLRNKLAHPGIRAALDEDTFGERWGEAEIALLRLGVDENTIRTYHEANIDQENAGVAIQQVTSQYAAEFNSLLKRVRLGNRRQYLLFAVIGSIVVALVIAVILIERAITSKTSCANHIHYQPTSYGNVGYLTKQGWGGRKPTDFMLPLELPVDSIVISSVARIPSGSKSFMDDCCEVIRTLQKMDMVVQGLPDIRYNYLIGCDPKILFVGRGRYYMPPFNDGWNPNKLLLGVLGENIWETLYVLEGYIEHLVESNVLVANYTMFGLCQIDPNRPNDPGPDFIEVLQAEFKNHWNNSYHNDECNMKLNKLNP